MLGAIGAELVRLEVAFLWLGASLGGVLSISASVGEHYITPAEVAGMDALVASRRHSRLEPGSCAR
jgi:hypothetical protein